MGSKAKKGKTNRSHKSRSGTRRIARELAVQILYTWEIVKDDLGILVDSFFSYKKFKKPVADFAKELVMGMYQQIEEIDRIISEHIDNWHFDRLSIVDRNIMRCAVYQILYRDDIPSIVAINEAVDIAKKYGDMKSGNFVNGILDSILREKGSD